MLASNVAIGERFAANIGVTKGEQFNFGSDEPVQILDLVNRIIAAAGLNGKIEPEILLRTKIEREIDAQYLSGEKMRWSPRTSLDIGLGRTLTWYRENLRVFL